MTAEELGSKHVTSDCGLTLREAMLVSAIAGTAGHYSPSVVPAALTIVDDLLDIMAKEVTDG